MEGVRLQDERRKAHEKTLNDLTESRNRLQARAAAVLSEIGSLREEARGLRDRIVLLASDLRVALPEGAPAAAGIDRPTVDAVLESVRARLAEARQQLEAALQDPRVRFARSSPGFPALAIVLVLLHAGGLLAVHEQAPGRLADALVAGPVSLVFALAAAHLFRSRMKRRGHRVVDPMLAGVMESDALLLSLEQSWKGRDRQIQVEFQREKAERVAALEERFRALAGQAKDTAGVRAGILEEQRDHATETADGRRDRRLEAVAARQEREAEAIRSELESAIARQHALHAETLQTREREEADRLARAWNGALRDFSGASDAARRKGREHLPPWSDPRWQRPTLPADFPDGVYLGDVRYALPALVAAVHDPPVPGGESGDVAVPLELAFPAQGNLIVGMDPETRERSIQALFSTVLRILCAFPAGKAKFILFDPVGLGQEFSALMHLADFEESLVGGRIWTETVHFERKLAELTEHIEKVIQKYLRNRYASIGEYNREVAQLAEAYRFLIISDFPTGFSELALERLSSIVTSGARCGVHTLILRDRKQKLPAALSPAVLKGKGGSLLLQATEGGFTLEDESLGRGLLAIESPPPPEALTSLLHAVGRQCVDAARVELAFETVAPKTDRLWSESAEGGVRIPLGRASADRLQYLDLGRGTAQHALIAGKTGSGKSTLFHVMVTNAALWYSPREVELYLIDFKKGVEFKTYAVHGLPHARVVAIESDREFGLSVLRRIDRELTDRAERFRECGVQDFASHRKAGTAVHLPRTLLLIDEFQEFFVEEDAIAQESALLLDRIVRQGRAFGVHVVLGSQTLGGSYTLARTTLGQMAVRIALQCNEADSYLILNDDNSAARLLSRPGEAIYNDMSGMVEGNNPFQVAWLPDEVRERFLQRAGERAAREPADRPPMTIFEGNVPAELRNNPLLRERLARPPDADGGVSAWVGEANAIKGPTEVRFKNQGSSNLLIVGQQREAALSVLASTLVSLAAACPANGARFIVLDGSPPELGHGRHFDALAAAIPQPVDRVEYARVPAVLEELDAEVRGRMEGSRPPAPRIFLVVHDIQRFRQIRQRNEFDFGGGEEAAGPSADRCFATVLNEGPAQRIHTVVWSDSVNNLNRTLNRKTLREFQMRILFQMSAADSSELIDTPHASTLGLYRGLLFLEEDGTVEKFRPYAIPDPETLEMIRNGLRTRAV